MYRARRRSVRIGVANGRLQVTTPAMSFRRSASARHSLDGSDDGASAVEYGLLIAAIAAVVVGIVFALGIVVNGAFSRTSSCVAAEVSSTC